MRDRVKSKILSGLVRAGTGCPLLLTLAVGAVCGGNQQAKSAVNTRYLGYTVSAANVASYNLDVDQNGTTDFTFQAAYVPDPVLTVGFDQIEFPFGGGNGVVIDTQTNDGFPPTSLLKSGAMISSASLFCLSGDDADLFYDDTLDPTTGNFGGQTGYVGFRFTAADGTHYGYAQVTVKSLNSAVNPLDLTIGTVAYNTTPGQAITISSVPEPMSAAIMGAAGVGILLRRRRATQFSMERGGRAERIAFDQIFRLPSMIGWSAVFSAPLPSRLSPGRCAGTSISTMQSELPPIAYCPANMATENRFNPLDYPVTTLEPLLATRESAWLEHIPLAYLLIDLVRPACAVELGVHFGDSYCAFCQAVSHLGLPTRMFGVDTWRGDKHAGNYGPEILGLLRQHHDGRYGGFSTLMPMEFDVALSHFADKSVDLLHIDGLHTYDAVKHDFESWRPKMSNRGVVLFHDTQDRTGDFGVYQFWAELAGIYPHFEFIHGPGLGILAVGAEVPAQLHPLLGANAAEAKAIRSYYAQLGREISLRRFLTQIMRTVFTAQAVVNDWKRSTGQTVALQAEDIRLAMNESLGFAQSLVTEIEALAQSEMNHRRGKR